jgi:flagellar basal-body rod protein FlgB
MLNYKLIGGFRMAITSIIGTDTDSYGLMKEGIKAATVRGKAISNNIANINTENYKRFNVVFEENLNKDSKSNVDLKVTNQRHLTGSNATGDITVEKDNSTSMRTDGNNVDLEVEKVNQAANTLKYNALVQQANSKLTNIKYVIAGGK